MNISKSSHFKRGTVMAVVSVPSVTPFACLLANMAPFGIDMVGSASSVMPHLLICSFPSGIIIHNSRVEAGII